MKALSGIRVLDLTHMLSGPYCAMMLADMGAETIKVEPPKEGEGTRKLLANDAKNSIDGMGAYFLTLNRNKQSVTIDLKSEQGRELFYELVAVSDVVLYNFSAGVAERLQIHHAALQKHNPRVISVSITGFGETGPNKNAVSFDMVAQGTGGGMSITGETGGRPMRSGIPIGDLGGGLMGTIGTLSALQARTTTGRGQHVDISMQDAQVSMLNYMATMYFLSGETPGPLGNGHFVHVPYDTFPTNDGWVIIAVITDAFWKNLMATVDLPELDTQENERQPGRWKNRHLINGKIAERFQTNTSAHWLAKMREARIPSAPVNNFDQTLNDPHVLARNMVVQVPHANGRVMKQVGNPIKMSDTHEDTFTAPPLLGADTERVLANLLKKTKQQLDKLRAEGVI
jgi:crotonobetainyl-CoA:carnitine CoA-transferase CaiB-like acyl-CoA transferase